MSSRCWGTEARLLDRLGRRSPRRSTRPAIRRDQVIVWRSMSAVGGATGVTSGEAITQRRRWIACQEQSAAPISWATAKGAAPHGSRPVDRADAGITVSIRQTRLELGRHGSLPVKRPGEPRVECGCFATGARARLDERVQVLVLLVVDRLSGGWVIHEWPDAESSSLGRLGVCGAWASLASLSPDPPNRTSRSPDGAGKGRGEPPKATNEVRAGRIVGGRRQDVAPAASRTGRSRFLPKLPPAPGAAERCG